MAKREARLHPPVSTRMHGGIFGKVTKTGNVIINMHPTARIVIKDGAELVLNAKLPHGSNQECVLILQENATFVVNGRFELSYGTVFQLFANASLTVGKGHVNAYATFSISRNAIIGDSFLCGRHFQMMDSDFHKIISTETGEHINPVKSNVVIGKHVWLGEGVIITKDVKIGDNSVVGAHSVVTRSIPSNCLAVGNPAKVVKEDITWEG